MSTGLFINTSSSLFNLNRGGTLVRGGLTLPFSTIFYRKYPKSSKMVQNVMKAPNFPQSCTIVYKSILERGVT